jgi:hypothetical protein
MARIVWGAAGERRFETGVDRGVLYVPGLPGVPWNGLKSVREAPSGGEPQPYYLDGIKYANVSAAEEFKASISAFSAPVEFAQCDGSKMLAAGLFVTQQPRKSFGLSYRTREGDDLAGSEAGHKIHLVYGALAAPSGRSNGTLSNSITPLDLSWEISTRPPITALGYKPSAHLVIHTRTLDPEILELLEIAIYGDEATTPSLPSQEDILGIMS